MDVFVSQYEWIQRSREILFNYCETLATADYIEEIESYGGDSIRSLHAHVADCYRIWLGNRALGKSISHITPDSISNVQEMREVFKKIDRLVHEFLHEYKGEWDKTVNITFRSGASKEFTALWLFTHTTTHEFHHKGQIVKLGRMLGYIPPETDLVEP